MSKGRELRKPKAKRLPAGQAIEKERARVKERPVDALDSVLNPVPRQAPAEKISGKRRRNPQP